MNADTHIATIGQSWQVLLFCVSGQHGMSPDIDIMSLIPLPDSPIAAAGEASGAATSPAIIKIASKRPMRQRTFITYHPIGRGT